MCYAAIAAADLRELEREFAALIDVEEFRRIFWGRVNDPKAFKIPIALDRQFFPATKVDIDPASASSIAGAIAEYRRGRTLEWSNEIEKLVARREAAQRKLETKVTKAALKDVEVTNRKQAQIEGWLKAFQATQSRESDRTIYAMNYGPVIIQTANGRRITPMRYHCRLPAHAPFMDGKLAGNYNARLDNIDGFWKPLFGASHALLVLTGFRENVKRHDLEQRELRPGEAEENVILQFRPDDGTKMLVPCVWSHWEREGEVLNSMALITDDPPVEVRAAGHNRCPINLTRDAALSWLEPQGRSSTDLFEILGLRHRPHYEHTLADAA